jgi:hypothetical protein
MECRVADGLGAISPVIAPDGDTDDSGDGQPIIDDRW